MKNKKKRKLKTGFKIILFIFFILLIAGALYILNKEKVINIQNTWQTAKSYFVKDKNNENQKEDENINLNDFAALFKSRLPSKGLAFASSSEISSNGDMKIYLKNTPNDSGYLYINTNDKAEYIWITFVSAIDAEPLKTKLKNNLEELEYLDLRFSNKVFYKFQDAALNASQVDKESDTKAIVGENNNTGNMNSGSTSSSTTTPNEEEDILRAQAFSTPISTSSSTQ